MRRDIRNKIIHIGPTTAATLQMYMTELRFLFDEDFTWAALKDRRGLKKTVFPLSRNTGDRRQTPAFTHSAEEKTIIPGAINQDTGNKPRHGRFLRRKTNVRMILEEWNTPTDTLSRVNSRKGYPRKEAPDHVSALPHNEFSIDTHTQKHALWKHTYTYKDAHTKCLARTMGGRTSWFETCSGLHRWHKWPKTRLRS